MTRADGTRAGPTMLLWAVAAVAVLGLVADAFMGPPAPLRFAAESQEVPLAGTWYCPVVVGHEETATLSIAAVGDRPSIVTVERYAEGESVADPAVQLTPGDQIDIPLPPGQATTPLRVRWLNGPAVASWRLETGDAASANCLAAPSRTWYVAGLDTAAGARSFLQLFNPFGVDAVARVVFSTSEGVVPLVLTDNILVPAGTTYRMPLNEFQPEQADLGAAVAVLAGRLVATGEIFDGRGHALVEAVPAATLEASFAFGKSDRGTTSWLSIMNPNPEEALVEVRVSDPRPDAPGLSDVAIPPGATVRVDLAEQSSQSDYGVMVASLNDQPVVVVRGMAVRTSTGRQGLALSTSRGTSNVWALPGGGTGTRQTRVNLYNPGPEAVSVTVETTGGGLPEWSAIVLNPNGRASLQLEQFAPNEASLPTVVRASAPITAELRLVDALGTLRLWSSVGIPQREWVGPVRRPVVHRDPTLSTRPLAD